MSKLRKTNKKENEILKWTSSGDNEFNQTKEDSLNIAILGTENSGKSSLLNSLFSSYNQHYGVNVTSVGTSTIDKTGQKVDPFLERQPHTKFNSFHNLFYMKDTKKKLKNLNFIDTIRIQDISEGDFNYGPNDEKYEDFSRKSFILRDNKRNNLQVHGAIICISPYNLKEVKKDDKTIYYFQEVLMKFYQELSKCGIPCVCVCNNLDSFNISPDHLSKVQNKLYEKHKNNEEDKDPLYKMYKFIRDLGFADENIYFNINYSSSHLYQDPKNIPESLEKIHIDIIYQTLWNTEILFRNLSTVEKLKKDQLNEEKEEEQKRERKKSEL